MERPLPERIFTLSSALGRLRLYCTLDRDIAHALARLSTLRETYRFLHLYRVFFPDDFAQSEASATIDPGLGYSPCEVEFFFLVNARLFPLHIEYILMAGGEGNRPQDIFCGLRPARWRDEPPAELSVGWQILLALSGDQAAIDALYEGRDLPHELYEELAAAGTDGLNRPQRARLVQMCQDIESPLRELATALALGNADTGNHWLDFDPDREVPFAGYTWCEEDVREIAECARQACTIEGRAASLAGWLDRAPADRVVRLLDLIRRLRDESRQSEGR